MNTTGNHPRRRRGGFTMMEALMALSITAMLMVAMGGAFVAAGDSIQQNDSFYRAQQQARGAMDLITAEIRRCTSVTATSSAVTLTAASSDFNGDSLTFTINGAGASTNPNTITMTDNTAGTTSVLASDVTNATFSYQSNFGTIALTMTVTIAGNDVTLSNSAAPRYLVGTLGSSWN